MTDHTFERPSSGKFDASGLSGPPSKDGCLYLALRLQQLGIKDRLKSVHTTPEDAFRAVVEHAGTTPDDYEPDWPEGNWGDEVWGWHTDDGVTYVIQQYRWSGIDTDDRVPSPTEEGVKERVDHSDRKPVCDCADPDPKTLGADTPVEFQVCETCSGVIE